MLTIHVFFCTCRGRRIREKYDREANEVRLFFHSYTVDAICITFDVVFFRFCQKDNCFAALDNCSLKLKYPQIKKYLALSLSDVVFIMLINIKMPTIVGILTFMSRINFVFSRVEHEKSQSGKDHGCSLVCRKKAQTRLRGCKTFSCSSQPSMKFQLVIKTKILKNKTDYSCSTTFRCCIYPADKC